MQQNDGLADGYLDPYRHGGVDSSSAQPAQQLRVLPYRGAGGPQGKGAVLAAKAVETHKAKALSYWPPIRRVVVFLAVDETVILLHPPLPLVGVSIVMERERQQNDRTLANG